MASRSFLSLFLQTREHLEVSDRIQRYAVVSLLLFQLVLLWPLANAGRLLEQQEAESQALSSILDTLEGSSERLETSHAQALQTLTPAFEDLIQGLRLDFEQLDAAVAEVRAGEESAPSDTVAEEGDQDSGEEEGDGASDNPDLSEESENLWVTLVDIPTVREAQNRYSLLTALEPLVDEEILGPRFADLTATWTQQTRSPFEGETEALIRQLASLSPRRAELTTTWNDFTGSLGGLRRAIVEFELSPPQRAYWWASPEEEPELRLGLAPATVEELRTPRALDELRVMMARTLEHRDSLEKRLRTAQQALANDLNAQSGGGGKFLGIDLHSLLTIWPLLLGFLLALVVFHRSHRLRQLGLLTHLMVEHGAPPNLNRWFLAEMRGALTPSKPLDPVARACLLRGLGLLAVGWLWIIIAAVQAEGQLTAPWQGIQDLGAHWPALVGCGSLLLAVLHRLYLNGRLIDLFQEEPIEPPPEILADDEEKEPFGIQDLRR